MRLSEVKIQVVLVEDSPDPENNEILKNFANRFNTLQPTNIRIQLLTQNTVRTKNGHRGVFQRNKAMNWVMKNHKNSSAVVYLADDDNTYDERLFQEFIKIGGEIDGNGNKTVMGILPVGLVGGSLWEGPICENGLIHSWHSKYKPERTFALDMAGFAFTVQALIDSNARFSQDWTTGTLETQFASTVAGGKFGPLTGTWQSQKHEIKRKVVALGNNCTEVLVWHTKTIMKEVYDKYGEDFEVK